MVVPIRFALFADPARARPAFDELAAGLALHGAPPIEPLFVASYAGLAQAVDDHACELAWLPPVIAHGALSCGTGTPLVAVVREGGTSYYSVLVRTRGGDENGMSALSGRRVGWVSKLSAAGYLVPYLYLQSLGAMPNELFQSETFLGSHDRAITALLEGDIDVAATYAKISRGGRTLVLPARARAGTRVVMLAGPIAGDAVFVGSHVGSRQKDALRKAFVACSFQQDSVLSKLMDVESFAVPTIDHFSLLQKWRLRAEQSEREIIASFGSERSEGTLRG